MPTVSLGLTHSLCVMFMAVYGWAGALCLTAVFLLPFVIGVSVLLFLTTSMPCEGAQYSFPGEDSVSNADLQIPLLF